MEIPEHLAALRHDGDLLAATAARSGLDGTVPTCPGWRMRDLVRHVGGVHRWAAVYVAERRTKRMDKEEEARVTEAWPADGGLVDWFRDGHAFLVRTLETADPGLVCWSFLPAPSPLAFWARRQAHETAVHRADAERTAGAVTPFPPAFALDGIDELLSGFLGRPGGRLRADPPRTLHLHATDAAGDRLVHIGPERVVVSRDGGPGDCAVSGRASDLYLLLWNRCDPDGLDVRGDRSVLDLWRERVRVRWS